jgi:hypothetical protein
VPGSTAPRGERGGECASARSTASLSRSPRNRTALNVLKTFSADYFDHDCMRDGFRIIAARANAA